MTTKKNGKNLLKIVTINLPQRYLDLMDILVNEVGLYPSRSELIRVAMRDWLIKELEFLKASVSSKIGDESSDSNPFLGSLKRYEMGTRSPEIRNTSKHKHNSRINNSKIREKIDNEISPINIKETDDPIEFSIELIKKIKELYHKKGIEKINIGNDQKIIIPQPIISAKSKIIAIFNTLSQKERDLLKERIHKEIPDVSSIPSILLPIF